MIAEYLSAQRYSVDSVSDGASSLAHAYERAYDLIILDVMLPLLDGFEVLRSLRRRSDVPVILLTARDSEADRLQGFVVGADDYLPKPFDVLELLMRAAGRIVSRDEIAPAPARGGPTESTGVSIQSVWTRKVGGMQLSGSNRELTVRFAERRCRASAGRCRSFAADYGLS